MKFSLHPNVYSTDPQAPGLRPMLEQMWVRSHEPGDGTFYILSGFANFNGGARFYRTFQEHTEQGGRVVAVLGASSSMNQSSSQVVEALLESGAEVHLVNRKAIFHAKCYGKATASGANLVVTSGNFTAPGMARNVEAALLLDSDGVSQVGFDWESCISAILSQNWLTYQPTLQDRGDPGWSLLYDERTARPPKIDVSDEVTLLVVLGHSDTARILAAPGTDAAKGSQYFWLSKDSFDFFPPLTIRNARGFKSTLSAIVTLHYIDLRETDGSCRVTYEAGNNSDFRLGTGRLRHSGLAKLGDLACVTRVGEAEYELRIVEQGTVDFQALSPYASVRIGNRGKRYGYVENARFWDLMS